MEDAKRTDYSLEDMRRACLIAEREVVKRGEQFKPSAGAIKNARPGWACAQTFLGSKGEELGCEILLQWNYNAAGGIGRIYQVVHARLRTIQKDGQRYLRLVELHAPDMSDQPCSRCGADFTDHQIIKSDTSLHEF
jgi:hypothetical protein